VAALEASLKRLGTEHTDLYIFARPTPRRPSARRWRRSTPPCDPGVPDWRDTGDPGTGAIQFRWMQASSAPVPSVTLVKLADLPSLFPADKPRVSPEVREQTLRERRRGVQLRGHW